MPPTPAELLQKHKLFSKLSGQVVWNLAEEAGAGASQLEAFMDFFEAQKARAAALLDALARDPDLWLILDLDAAATACPACARLAGLAVPATHPAMLDYLPPFGLGCSLTGRPGSPDQTQAGTAASLPPAPVHKLCCDQRPLTLLLAERTPAADAS
ncbi:hypothetical protein [Desulfovibrio sp. TomC]|uniref:hypothetical protein n=1 Tax=Desulfovibrio sp. TomC TaxID=1562888 RepID=UPI0005735024|nr:hypothetical protein [Desulfovibrio sp. TomC]KHK01128.1 hypothetical protein NY78_3509 [Desulfovibrio sp. TomC]